MNTYIARAIQFFLTNLILLFSLCATKAQTLTGRIHDVDGKPVSEVNVLLLNTLDSSLVKGAVSTETGTYRIDRIITDNYLLSFSRSGYQTVYLPVSITSKKDHEMPTVALPVEVKDLRDVKLISVRPFLEQKIDRTVMNVANSIVSTGGSALDALEKAPGVMIDRQQGIIALRGKDGVMVHIDGRPTYLNISDVIKLLQNIPASELDRIEFITNPSARYDAEGNAGIISIYRKKNKNQGTSGTFSVTAGSGKYDREQTNLQLSHRTKKVSLFGSYGFNRGDQGYWDFTLNRDWTENGERNLVTNLSKIRFYIHGHQARAGVDINAGRYLTLGLLATRSWYYQREKAPSDVKFRHAPEEPVYYHTETAKTILDKSDNQLINLHLIHNRNSGSKQFSVDIDFGRFDRLFNNTLKTYTHIPDTSNGQSDDLLTEMPVSIDILSFKTDYTTTLTNDWNLETGFKTSRVESRNNMQLFSGKSGSLNPDTNLSNNFKYTEKLVAGYIIVSGKWKNKTHLQGGLRGEFTSSTGHSISQNSIVKRNYFDLFPSVFISHSINDTHQVTMSYSYRIQRPDYQSLNPARSYLDPFAFSAGNPYLNPAYTHSLELRHGFMDKLFTSVGMAFTREYVYKLIQPVNKRQTERKPFNVGRLRHYNITVGFPITITTKWKARFNATGAYGRLNYIFLEKEQIARQLYGRMDLNQTWSFGKGWSAELSGWLVTPGVSGGMFRNPWLGALNMGLQKSWTSNWKLRLSALDILHSDRWVGYFRNEGFYFRHQIVRDSRVVMVSLSYSFGSQKDKTSGTRRTGSEEEMKRTSSN